MAEPDYRNLEHWRTEQNQRLAGLRGGGGGDRFDPMEERVATLEKRFDRFEAKLDTITSDVAEIKGKITGLPDAGTLGEIKGRLNAMPTTIQLLLFVVAIFTASGMLRYFGH